VTFQWEYVIGGKRIAAERRILEIEPGFGKEVTIHIATPATDHRLEGTLRIRLSQKGAEDYLDERLVPVLPRPKLPRVTVPVWVLDRKGALSRFLSAAGLNFERLGSLDEAKDKRGLLLIGHDTLTPAEAYGTAALAFAAAGGTVICLEQDNPLAGSAATTSLTGRETTRPTRTRTRNLPPAPEAWSSAAAASSSPP